MVTLLAMPDRDDSPRSASGVPIDATDEQLAAAQDAVAGDYDRWADGQDAPVPAAADGPVWPEAGLPDAPDPAQTAREVRRATES